MRKQETQKDEAEQSAQILNIAYSTSEEKSRKNGAVAGNDHWQKAVELAATSPICPPAAEQNPAVAPTPKQNPTPAPNPTPESISTFSFAGKGLRRMTHGYCNRKATANVARMREEINQLRDCIYQVRKEN